MKNIFLTGIIVLLAFYLLKCRKDVHYERDWPIVNTLPVTEITKLGAKFNAEITYRGNSKILNHGFVWSVLPKPTLEVSDKIVFSEDPGTDEFSAEITTALGANLLIHVRSFIKTAGFTVYGQDVEFVSLGSKGPEISGISPVQGSWGDTIYIKGKNFSNVKENNTVKLGNIKATVILSSDTVITCTVPEILNTDSVKISVAVLGSAASSGDYFRYLIPVITGISPATGTYLDTIVISGRNLGKLKKYTSVSFELFFNSYNSVNAEIISCDTTHIRLVVPVNLKWRESVIGVTSVGHALECAQRFSLNPPEIISIVPDTVFHPDDILTVIGENFSPLIQNNRVEIGGHTAQILEASGEMLRCQLPAGVIGNYRVSFFEKVNLFITAAEMTDLVTVQILWHSTWTRKKDFPGQARYLGAGFSINGKGYFGTGTATTDNYMLRDFWEYDPVIDQWIRITDFPGSARAATVAFTLNGNGFVGSGTDKYVVSTENDKDHFRDFYKFDPGSGTWTRINDFPGVGRHSATCFVINNEGYVGTGHWGNDYPYGNLQAADDFWKYNPLTNLWSEIQKFPEPAEGATGFEINGKGYIYNFDKMFVFDGNSWTRIPAPVLESTLNVAFSINNSGYFGLGDGFGGATNYFWQYNPVSFSSADFSLGNDHRRYGSSAFVIDNKAYIIGGINFNHMVINEVWEFDPSKP